MVIFFPQPLKKNNLPHCSPFLVVVSGEVPDLWKHLFVFCWMSFLCSVLSCWFEDCRILRQKNSTHTVHKKKLLGTFLHIMQHAFSFPQGCRAAILDNDKWREHASLVGGKCQLLQIHQQHHCLFSLEVIASLSPWFWANVRNVTDGIVILKPAASLSTSAPQANFIVGQKKLHVCSEIVSSNSPPPNLSNHSNVGVLLSLSAIFRLLYPSSSILISDFSHILAWAYSAPALQSVGVWLLFRQRDGCFGSGSGWMPQ